MITVTGIKEIDRVLRGLPFQLQDRLLQNAAAASAKPLVEAEKLAAPEGPNGDLIDSIGVVKGRFSGVTSGNRDIGQVTVGARRGGKFKGYHAHLVEYGTKKRSTRKGANRGSMPAKPFAEPSFKRTKEQILYIYNEQVGRVLINFMNRTLRK